MVRSRSSLKTPGATYHGPSWTVHCSRWRRLTGRHRASTTPSSGSVPQQDTLQSREPHERHRGRATAVTDGCCALLPGWEFSRLSVHSSSEDAQRSRPRRPVSACTPSLSPSSRPPIETWTKRSVFEAGPRKQPLGMESWSRSDGDELGAKGPWHGAASPSAASVTGGGEAEGEMGGEGGGRVALGSAGQRSF